MLFLSALLFVQCLTVLHSKCSAPFWASLWARYYIQRLVPAPWFGPREVVKRNGSIKSRKTDSIMTVNSEKLHPAEPAANNSGYHDGWFQASFTEEHKLRKKWEIPVAFIDDMSYSYISITIPINLSKRLAALPRILFLATLIFSYIIIPRRRKLDPPIRLLRTAVTSICYILWRM